MTNIFQDADVKAAATKMATTLDKTQLYVSMEQSQAYATYRPKYTPELYQYMVDYARETNPCDDLAVDVGCGPGSSTLGLAKHFKRVIGVDVSPTQIACAPKDIPNVEFMVGYSDKLPFIQDGTVDFFCTGESFNLMPHKETFAEADRVLKPGGTFAIFGYSNIRCSHPIIQAAHHKIVVKLFPYWAQESKMIFEKFKDIELPYPDTRRKEDMVSPYTITMTEYMGLMHSLWPFVAYCQEHPEDDYQKEIQTSMTEAVKKANGSKGDLSFEILFDYFAVMTRKPKK